MKKYFFVLFVLLIQCKIALLENRTEVPKVSNAFYHLEIGGLQNNGTKYIFELVFSKPFSEEFDVVNFEINEIPKNFTKKEFGKIIVTEKFKNFQDLKEFKYKTRIYYKMKTYDIEGVFQKSENIYRP